VAEIHLETLGEMNPSLSRKFQIFFNHLTAVGGFRNAEQIRLTDNKSLSRLHHHFWLNTDKFLFDFSTKSAAPVDSEAT
jgi:hypothetical protein